MYVGLMGFVITKYYHKCLKHNKEFTIWCSDCLHESVTLTLNYEMAGLEIKHPFEPHYILITGKVLITNEVL